MTARAGHPAAHGQRPVSPRARMWTFVVGVSLIVVVTVAVVFLRVHRGRVLSSERAQLEQERARGLRITVTRVPETPGQRSITLPGDVRGYNQATLYAKVSGYIRDMRVDRGDHVVRGQVLALIDAPETDRDLAAAEQSMRIARINSDRDERLAPSGVVSQQDRDNAVAMAKVSGENLGRAMAIQAYTVIRAPFDGVVTARYVDRGALVPAATGSTQSAMPVVDVSMVDTLRVFVYVGQDAAPFVRVGDPVTIWQDELPSKRIPGTITRMASALDPRTRTMQVEIDVDNRPWGVLPGTFAHVELRVPEPKMPVVPDEALVIRDGKTTVATVVDGKVHYVVVNLGYNDGRNVRVMQGLAGSETLGLDVPVEVQEGDTVQAVPQTPPSTTPSASSHPSPPQPQQKTGP